MLSRGASEFFVETIECLGPSLGQTGYHEVGEVIREDALLLRPARGVGLGDGEGTLESDRTADHADAASHRDAASALLESRPACHQKSLAAPAI
jgi:hypothetical protein